MSPAASPQLQVLWEQTSKSAQIYGGVDAKREPVSSYRSHAGSGFCVFRGAALTNALASSTSTSNDSALHSAAQNVANCRYVKILPPRVLLHCHI